MILLPDDGSGDGPTQGIVQNNNIAILPNIMETNEDGVPTAGVETLLWRLR